VGGLRPPRFFAVLMPLVLPARRKAGKKNLLENIDLAGGIDYGGGRQSTTTQGATHDTTHPSGACWSLYDLPEILAE